MPRPGALLAAVLVAGAALLAGCASTGAGQADRDAAAVFCLTGQHRPDLVDAAVVLGTATPGTAPETVVSGGREYSLEDWRRDHAADFDRTCAALLAADGQAAPAAGSSGSGLGSALLSIGSLILGAALTGGLTTWRDAVTRRRQRADGLRRAAVGFEQALGAFLRSWTGAGPEQDQSAQPVQRARDELAGAVRDARLLRPAGPADTVLTELTGDQLGEAIGTGWGSADRAERSTRAAAVRARLAEVTGEVRALALALERPVRARRGAAR
jgi:hypothetical protein